MHFVRKLGLWLSLFVFSAMLSLFVFSFVTVQTVGNPETVKGWLDKSNTYQNFLDLATEEIRVDPEGEQQSLVNDEMLKEAIRSSFTAEDARGWVEVVIDSLYSWLNQETDTPEFRIDYGAQADAFIESLATAIESRYLALPECTNIAQAQASEQDPLNASCQVPGVNMTEVRQRLRAELQGEDGPFDTTVFSAEDIKVSPDGGGLITGTAEESQDDQQTRENGVPFYQEFDNAPQTFARIKQVPWLSLVVATLFAVAVVFLASSKRAGLRKIGWRIITSSIVSIVLSLLVLFGSRALLGAAPADNADEVQDMVVPLVNEMLSSFIIYSVVVAGILLAIGLLMIILTRKPADPHKKMPSKPAHHPTTSA